MLDWILWIIVSAFWAWEAYAHFILHNKAGHTLSNRIRLFEKLTGWPGHAIVGAVLVVLFIHFQVL